MSERRIVLLGPQRLTPTLNRAVAEHAPHGPLAAVTAGWEEREGEDQELSEHLGGRILNLAVFHRVEEVFRTDRELFALMQARHDATRSLQELYRLQLAHALESARALLTRRDLESWLIDPERDAAVEAVRRLDARHLERVRAIHADFETRFRLAERDSIARHRAEIGGILAGTAGLCIAGGHVAILLNRLRVLDVLPLSGSQPVFAWSAGAMALAERVVLFHDSPPQGAGDPEVLEHGLGVAPGVVPLPHARRRLRLEDPARVSAFARRFGPALCVALDPSTRIERVPGGWRSEPGTQRLAESGELVELGLASAGGVA